MASETPHDSESGGKNDRPRRPRAGLRHLLASGARLVDIQYKIWLTQAKIAALRIAIFASLFVGAISLAVLAVIFLVIGIFRVLTDVLGLPIWASFLIFGGVLAIIAIILISIATHMITRSDEQDEKKSEKEARP